MLPAGSKAEFQCQSTGSRPAAQISWWLGTERLSNNVRDSVNEDGNATISTIIFVPSIEDNGKMLTCRADNLPMPHTALKDERLLNVQCKFYNVPFQAHLFKYLLQLILIVKKLIIFC